MGNAVLPLWLVAALAGLAFGALAQEADRGKNHYILGCGDGCFPTLKAIGAPHGIVTDATGNVYFSSQSVVFKLSRGGGLARVAGTGEPGYTGDNGPAVQARLNFPDVFPDTYPFDTYPMLAGLAVGADGALYIADARNDRTRRVGPDGTISTMIDERTGDVKIVRFPQGLGFDASGAFYVSTSLGGLSRLDPDGTFVDVLSPECRFEASDVACGSAQIAIDPAGAVYFPDALCRVRKWTAQAGVVTVAGQTPPVPWNSRFPCDYRGDGGPATQAGLSQLSFGVAIDGVGRLIIADTFDHCIRRVDSAGVITTVAGNCGAIPYAVLFSDWPPSEMSVPLTSAEIGDDGPATFALLSMPMGVAVDPDGTIYIADTGHLRVRRVTPDGIITTVAGNGMLYLPMSVGSATTAP